MAVLCGTYDRYEGEICINNQPVTIREPLDAKRLGIHLVQQEVDVALIPGLSIAENIMLDQLALPGHRYRWRAIRQQAKQRWRSWVSLWMCDASSTPARWQKSSRFCWRGRSHTTAVF